MTNTLKHPTHKIILGATMALSFAALTACNTIEGAGEDIEAGGKAVQGTAEKTKEKLKE